MKKILIFLLNQIQDLEIQNLKKIITNIKEETELKSKQITYQLQDIEKKQKEINELTIEIQNIKKNKTEQIHDEKVICNYKFKINIKFKIKTKESIEQIKNRRIDLLKIQVYINFNNYFNS